MGKSIVLRLLRDTYDAVFRPHQFVRVSYHDLQGSLWEKFNQLALLLIVFIANLAAYAFPLTIVGSGTAPDIANTPVALFIDSSTETGRFLLRFAQNSLYLTGAAGATFLAFHSGVLMTRSSQGILSSLHTVIYSTSGYLAAVFSLVVYIDSSERFAQTAAFVEWIQLKFIYAVVDATGADLVLANAGRPSATPPGGLVLQGQLLIAGLLLASMYYLYSMYLGSRINHDTSRITAALTLLAVLSIPIFFVIGSVVAVTAFGT
jgi:hypothetical protein